MALSKATRRLLIMLAVMLGLLVVIGVGGRALGLFKQETGIEVEVAKATRRTITQVVTASGRVQPEVEVTISPDVSGEIVELLVREGDRVERGQLLARIRPDFYEAQVQQAEAGVAQARATLKQREADLIRAEAEFKRQQALYEKQAISASDFEAARTQYEVAKAALEAARYAVESAEARLREAREQLAKTMIYAPMSGIVSKLDVELGERVVGTSQMAGTEMMRIARLDQMELEVEVNENDVVNVSVGDTATIHIDAYPERTFRGVVTEIANSARIANMGTQEQVTNFPVKVRILGTVALPEAGPSVVARAEEVPAPAELLPPLRPGMSGTVDIYTKTVFNAVAVPIQAVTVRDFNRVRPEGETAPADTASNPLALQEDLRKVVFIVEDGKARMVEVQTGISDDTHIEIVSGLQGGETVIIGPYRAVSQTLRPGMPVRIQQPRLGRRIMATVQ
ncbi:efflux RND transporter periplasmic adaptor subunit [Rhodothermus profundi]|uniref:HlyD family secretion protein n=1 Tax=Rhodothermus profundi TaxID=633813 RepID=A0A1M6RJA5_9BACT|nr:efflux RND transporter periplasmic adaptor subunit [Rhodothermus profundi]SHK32571.1 HlyD family secretion protein [Rhodothermus profundi]